MSVSLYHSRETGLINQLNIVITHCGVRRGQEDRLYVRFLGICTQAEEQRVMGCCYQKE